VSAGVDLFVSSIAAMLKVDDWIANGFEFDEDGFLSDDGICRLHASGKGDVINRLMQMHEFKAEEVVSVGDSEMDLSMMVPGSGFIGFNPSRESSLNAFIEAGVPIIMEKDLSKILGHIVLPSSEGN
jgi:phosphoserine phosphatase